MDIAGQHSLFMKVSLALAAAFVAAGAALASWMLYAGLNPKSVEAEVFKLILQFLLVTGLGAIIVAFLTFLRDAQAEDGKNAREMDAAARVALREQEARTAARFAALQDIDAELSRSYRRFKTLKRQLRAQALECERRDRQVLPPYCFEREAFEKRMDELLDAQIRLECLRDDLRLRTDLFGKKALARVRRRLRYAARYFHDVYEEFERGLICRDGELYRITDDCRAFAGFLGGGTVLGDDLPDEVRGSVQRYFEQVENERINRLQQHEALDRINLLRKQADPHRRRFRAIADDSFALASAEIRHEMTEAAKLPAEQNLAVVSNRSYFVPDLVKDA